MLLGLPGLSSSLWLLSLANGERGAGLWTEICLVIGTGLESLDRTPDAGIMASSDEVAASTSRSRLRLLGLEPRVEAPATADKFD